MFDMKSLTNSVEQESYLILSKIYISINETQDFFGNLLVDSMSWYESLSFPTFQLFNTYMNSR